VYILLRSPLDLVPCKFFETAQNISSYKIIHTFAERNLERRGRRERMEEFSLTVMNNE
jgi:hypothetical protein